MPPVYNLTASQCPDPQVPATYLDPADYSPTTAPTFASGDQFGPPSVTEKLRQLSAKVDALGRGGAGGYAVLFGLDLTDGGGLVVNVSAGQALLDGPVTRNTAFSVVLTNNDGRHYLWLGQNGTPAAVFNSLTPPVGAQVFLGSVLLATGAISSIDYSGRFQKLLDSLWTRYADAGEPGITPVATGSFWARTAGGLYRWDGVDWDSLGGSAAATLAANLADGTHPLGDNLIGYQRPLTGAAEITLHTKLLNLEIDAAEFTGVDKTGATDSTAGIVAALAATPAGQTLYFPAGIYLTSGITLTDKPINIRGDGGTATEFRPSGNNVVIWNLVSTDGSATPISYGTFSGFKIGNPSAFTGCTGMRFDRSRRNRVRDIRADNLAIAFDLRTAWIMNFEDCYILAGSTSLIGVDTSNSYAVGAVQGQCHNLTWQGGEITGSNVAGFIGMAIGSTGLACNFPAVRASSIEAVGAGGIGVRLRGCNGAFLSAAYWENPNGHDVAIDGFSDSIWLDNTQRVTITQSNTITLNGFQDVASLPSVLTITHDDPPQGVFNILMINPRWQENSKEGTTAVMQTVYDEWERGNLRVLGSNQVPWQSHGPTDYHGVSLLRNGEMLDGASGWSFTNMAANTATVPPFARASIATSGAGLFRAEHTPDVTYDSVYIGRFLSGSMWVNLPDNTWTAFVQLNDGGTGTAPTVYVPKALMDGTWHVFTFTLRVRTGATGFQFRIEGTAPAAGTAYFAGVTLTPGSVPGHPQASRDLLARKMTSEPRYIKAVADITNTGQINPFVAEVQTVRGSGGAVTMLNTQALFSASRDGAQVVLVGDSDTNTLTLVQGGSTAIRLGATTRVLKAGSVIGFLFRSSSGLWEEQYWGSAASAGANADITSMTGITGGITLTGGMNLSGIVKGNGTPLRHEWQTQAWPSDANYTPPSTVYDSQWLELTGGLLSTTRDLVLPQNSGNWWHVYNNTSGAQAINVRPGLGTGVTLPNGYAALVKVNGGGNMEYGGLIYKPAGGGPAWTPTNVTTDRSFDANATTLDEIADCLATLVADLQAARILS